LPLTRARLLARGLKAGDVDRAMHDARAEVQAAVDAATAAPWPDAQAAFTDIQDIGAGRWA